jgi:hypothetical protein
MKKYILSFIYCRLHKEYIETPIDVNKWISHSLTYEEQNGTQIK